MFDATVTIDDSHITGMSPRCSGMKFSSKIYPRAHLPIRQGCSARPCGGLAPGFHTGIATITNITAASRAPTTIASEITSIAVSLTVLPTKQLDVHLPAVRR